MAINAKLARLLNSLRDATREGRLRWTEGPYPNIYKLILEQATVFIEFTPEEGAHPPGYRGAYSVMLKNPENEVVELELFDDVSQPEYQLIDSLFDAARKGSSRFNDFLDRMIAEVDARKG